MIELLAITVILIVLVVLFAVTAGRKSGGDAKKTLEAARNAEEVKDEVEALASDTLRDRARTWVRRPKG